MEIKLDDHIHLRSEEVEEIMGQTPSWITRWGVLLISTILAGIVIGSYFFKYPESLKASITINSDDIPPIGYAVLPATGTGKLKKGLTVRVRLDNFPELEYGFVNGCLDSILPTPDERNNYHVIIAFPYGLTTNYGNKLPLNMQLMGNAEIIIKEKRLIQYIFHSLELF